MITIHNFHTIHHADNLPDEEAKRHSKNQHSIIGRSTHGQASRFRTREDRCEELKEQIARVLAPVSRKKTEMF